MVITSDKDVQQALIAITDFLEKSDRVVNHLPSPMASTYALVHHLLESLEMVAAARSQRDIWHEILDSDIDQMRRNIG